MRNLAQDIAKTYRKRLEAGLFAKYLSGSNILDVGYRRADPAKAPVVEAAVRVDLDYPGYDGIHLPFPDESQDAIFSNHTYEHIGDYRKALHESYRVLRIG